MNNKKLSSMMSTAISALQCVADEIAREEQCDCARQRREAEKARKAQQKRFCNCVSEFGMGWAVPAPKPLPQRDSMGRFVSTRPQPCGCAPAPRPAWGVGGCPPEDKNKRFGIKIMVDEPRCEDFSSRWAFENAHAKFDRLVDAAEACTWGTKATESTPLHKVKAIRRNVCDGPVMGVNLVGESHFWC